MAEFKTITSIVIPLLHNNIDTDQIIPARFLKCTDKESVSDGLFADWRYQPSGSHDPDFVLNKTQYQGAEILLAGDNFGCGSSREHAPWAMVGWGIRSVISTSFADIFKNNALKNGLLPVEVEPVWYQLLVEMTEYTPDAELRIDLENQQGIMPYGAAFDFPIDPFAKKCLLNDVDQMGYILSFEDQIRAFESQQAATLVSD